MHPNAVLPSPDEDFDAAIMRPKRRKRRSPNKAAASAAPAPVVKITDDVTESEAPQPLTVPINFADQDPEPEPPVAPPAEPEAPEAPAEPAPEPDFEPPAGVPEPESPEDVALSQLPAEAPTEVPEAATPQLALPQRRMARLRASRLRLAGEVVIVLALVALAGLDLRLTHQKASLSANLAAVQANPSQLVQQQTEALIGQVGRLMQLPQNETPTVASVSDAAQARSQSAFFKNAENGDKVLVYVKAGEAILYRPSTDRIILVAPLDLSGAAGTSTTPAQP